MVKLRPSQPTQPKKDEGKMRNLLSFSNFRRSFAAPRGTCNGVGPCIPSSVEIANACAGLNAMTAGVSEDNDEWHDSHQTASALGLACPHADTNSQISRVLHEISNSTKQNEVPSPAIQLAEAFNRWRYSHLKVEERLHLELVKAVHRAQTAEATAREKDIEIKRLREDLRKVEEDKNHIISKLQTKNATLQDENDFCYQEVKNAMDQLAGMNVEMNKRNSLGSYLGKQRKHAKEVIRRVDFSDERNLRKVDFSFEELGMTLHCRGADRPKASKAVSMELEQHLKKLTSYVRNLEACIRQGGHNERRVHSQQTVMQDCDFIDPAEPLSLCFETNNDAHVSKKNENLQSGGYSAACAKKNFYFSHGGFELNSSRDCTQNVVPLKQQPCLSQNQKLIQWSQIQSQERVTAVATLDTPQKFTDLLSRCISWKWRWAAAASQLEILSKELQNMTSAKNSKTPGVLTGSQSSANRDKFITSMQKLGFIHIQNLHNPHNSIKGRILTTKSKHKEAKFSVSGHKVISIMLSMWRASIKNAKLEKEVVCNGEKLSRLLAGLPWLIQKFEERRYLERMFYHWVLHMLRSKVHMCHASIYQSSSWSWQRQPSNSLWVTQLGLADAKTLEGNGYQGRYLKYNQFKPNERQQQHEDMRKSAARSPDKNDLTIDSHDCENKSVEADDGFAGFPSEFPYLSQRDHLNFDRNLTTALAKPSVSNKVTTVPETNDTDDIYWNKKHNRTTFTEKAMQALQVSLYNELQKLQELIMREARFHQEKVEEKESTYEAEGGSSASPFSTSLWKICNGLAHCLVEARNQISALAGNSDSKICQTPAAANKSYAASRNPTTLEAIANQSNDTTYQKTRFRILRSECENKKPKSGSADADFKLKQEPAKAKILEFAGVGKANRHMEQIDEADCLERGRFDSTLRPSSENLHHAIGLRHDSFPDFTAQQSVSSFYS